MAASADNIDDLEDAVVTAATDGIQSATGDQGEVVQMDPEKMLNVRDRLKASTSSSKNHLGIYFRTLKPGGCG